MSALTYGVGGFVATAPKAITGNGPPPASFLSAQLGQMYFDTSTTPPTDYIFNGQTWATGASSGSFVALAVSGAATVGTLTSAGAITATTGNISALAGNLSASGTVSGGTGVIATAGNLTASAVGSGLLLTPTVVAAGASPQTANGRAGQVTFSGVLIVSGGTQVFVINNTSITGAGTVILYGMSGATQGSAPTIQSTVNAAGTSTITLTNGTSATMVTDIANVTFTFLVLN